MNKLYFIPSQFDVEENTNISTDFEPAISIDHTNRLREGIKKLQEVLGITDMKPMPAGTSIKLYGVTVTKGGKQPAEGDIVPLSKVERKLIDTIELELDPKRRLTTGQAIQSTGKERAINEADEALIAEVRKDIKDAYYTTLAAGTGTAPAGDNFQKACANVWGALNVFYEDMDVTPVFFVNPLDVATYLGDAAISTQTAFGMSYIENFLGMGNAIISSKVEQGTVIGTAVQNLNGAFVPVGGDVATAFGLTYDASGLVGLNHSLAADRFSINSLLVSGVVFYAENAGGVFKATIG